MISSSYSEQALPFQKKRTNNKGFLTPGPVGPVMSVKACSETGMKLFRFLKVSLCLVEEKLLQRVRKKNEKN